ncbi:hypothetical protein N5D18_06320 [Enterobacter hormaechei]|uniref:hypothetical protein n=1 Tax=Enterobacter hormaechei TaxID=158836 RepID=UPI00244A7094|nr:hypothetical protein [Enterobacter hormaechei]MDH0670030.1 hypothetical protein [Enterobacter hormaechei]MDH0714558.1 hypothetical protein [Enterobacter hormaechei]HBK4747196.1 hypothetical protein [Enterobacter hormaechei subsp. steigerwaltii]
MSWLNPPLAFDVLDDTKLPERLESAVKDAEDVHWVLSFCFSNDEALLPYGRVKYLRKRGWLSADSA